MQNPYAETQIEQLTKLLLSDLNWLNKAIWKLNKALKGVLLCKV